MPQHSMLILIAHGSRKPRWLASIEELAHSLQAAHGQDRVRLAYMQCASPTLAQAISDAAESGQTKIRVLPLFLTLGGHVAREIQNQIDQIRQTRPDIEVQLLPPVGKHPLFMELLDKIIAEQLASKLASSPEEKNWQRSVGKFKGDPIMKEIIEEGQRIREQNRRRAD